MWHKLKTYWIEFIAFALISALVCVTGYIFVVTVKSWGQVGDYVAKHGVRHVIDRIMDGDPE